MKDSIEMIKTGMKKRRNSIKDSKIDYFQKEESMIFKFILLIKRMITNIKESIDNKMLPVLETRKIDPPVKRNSRSSKSYNNINLDQEFQKNEINNMSLEKKEYLS
jgi:hypothetical protein